MLSRFRKTLIQLLENTEDDLNDESIVPLPDKAAYPSLKDIRDNHLYHQALALNSLHIRMGRVEAKVGLILILIFAILGLAARPILQPIVDAIVYGLLGF